MYSSFFSEYRDQNGKQWILPSVKLAEAEIREEGTIIADYQFPNMELFSKLATKLVLGEDSPAIKEDRVSYLIFNINLLIIRKFKLS